MDTDDRKQIETCNWEQQEDGYWETDCGESFDIFNGTPIENSMNYCCYCGKSLAETPFEYE